MFFVYVSKTSLKKPHLEVLRWCSAVAIFTSNCPWIFKPFGKWISVLDDSWNGNDGNGSFQLRFCTYSMSWLFHFDSMEMEQDETMEFLKKRAVLTRCRFAAYLLVHGCWGNFLAHKVLAKLHDYSTETRWQFHLPLFASHMISYVFQFQANVTHDLFPNNDSSMDIHGISMGW